MFIENYFIVLMNRLFKYQYFEEIIKQMNLYLYKKLKHLKVKSYIQYKHYDANKLLLQIHPYMFVQFNCG